MKTGNGLSKAIWAAAVGVGVALVGHSQAQTAAGELPAMHMVNLSQETVAAILERATVIPAQLPQAVEPVVEPAPTLEIVAKAAQGYIVFADSAKHLNPRSTRWPQAKLEAMVSVYDEAVLNHYAAEDGFGSISRWAEAFGISQDNPIVVIYVKGDAHGAPARASWKGETPTVTHFTLRTSVPSEVVKLVIHELAHIWDSAHDWKLSDAMVSTVQNPEEHPTAKARDEGPLEDFAESVTATLVEGYAVNGEWTDDAGAQPDAAWTMDRFDFVSELLGR